MLMRASCRGVAAAARRASSASALQTLAMPNPFSTPERDAWRQSLREFVDTELKPFADEWDEAGAIPWEIHTKIGALGVWGFGISEEYGGLGFDDAFMR